MIFSADTICRRSLAMGWRSASIRITSCSACRSRTSTSLSCSTARFAFAVSPGDDRLGRQRHLAFDQAAHFRQQVAQAFQLLGEAFHDVLGFRHVPDPSVSRTGR